MEYPYFDSSCAFDVVPGDESFETHITVMQIITSVNLQVSLQIVSEDELLVTHSTGIWIDHSMTCHVSLYMVPEEESFIF